MDALIWSSLVTLISLRSVSSNDIGRNRLKTVCYLPTWAGTGGYRSFGVNQIDFTLCTHLIVAFGDIDVNGTRIEDSPNLQEKYKAILSRRDEYNPNVKVLLAIGGEGQSSVFIPMVATPESCERFIFNAIPYLRMHRLDGLDLDWEFPLEKPSKDEDKDRFTRFIKKFRIEIEAEARIMKLPKLLLTMAVGAAEDVIKKGYDIPQMSRDVDFFNVMSYNFYGSWNNQTGLCSGIYGGDNDTEYQAKLNQDWVIRQYRSLGAPAHKLILGIPTYGRSWRFSSSDSEKDAVGVKANGGPGFARPYSRTEGILAYYEVCKESGLNRKYDKQRKGNYGYSYSEWMCYDGIESVQDKAFYIMDKQLGGAMIWELSMEDFGNFCGNGKNPLLRKIRDVFLTRPGKTTSPQTTTVNTTETPGPTTGIPDETDTETPTTTHASTKQTQEIKTKKPEERRPTTAETETRHHVPFYLNPWGILIGVMAVVCVVIGLIVGLVIPRLNKTKI